MLYLISQLNLIAECRISHFKLWQCPPFLVLLLGLITVNSMIGTYLIATRYTEEPEVAALIVIAVAALFLVIGNLIIVSFNSLVETSRMKSEFISIVSHQLRSPLSILRWTLDVVLRDAKKDSTMDPLRNSLQTLRYTTERMVKLVNDLLEVSRIEAGTLLLKKEVFSLSELTQNTIDEFKKYAEAANLTFLFESDNALPPAVGDRERISMVMQNLVDNAVRYSRGPGKVLVNIRRTGGYLRWEIRDEGVGIPRSQQKFIFKKFFRAANSLRHQTEGTGIGLYIAKNIVEALGGKMGFQSEESRGSIFWFTLIAAHEECG